VKPASVVILLACASAHADPSSDLVRALQAIGNSAKSKPLPSTTFAAGASCAAVGKSERTAIEKRVRAWIDSEHSDEHFEPGDGDLGLVLHVGCKDPGGFVGVDVSEDRAPKTGFGTRRNYILRVTADNIDVVDQRTSTPSSAWSEWADEGRLELLGQLDLDGDGALDLLIGHYEKEGGDPLSFTHVSARLANGKAADVATVTNLSAAMLINGQLVLAGADKQPHVRFACVGKDLRLAPCAAITAVTKLAEQQAIADRYKTILISDLPDRDLLASELATLGVKAPADLLASAAATTPEQRTERRVAAWIAKAGLQYDFEAVMQPVIPEARPYLDRLATTLGDQPCAQTPLSTSDTAALTSWAHRQDEHLTGLAIQPSACGPYAWLSWSIGDDPFRREVLLARTGPTRILGFKWDVSAGMPGGPTEFTHDESFFTHGDAIVGIVLQAQNLWIVAAGKVVAQSKGEVRMYDYDARSPEAGHDVVRDSGALWHATPSGREKLDAALVHDHEPMRVARDLVCGNAPSADPKYVAALALLGADASLIAEVKALAP
jgi:hypothetical protein